jgi:acyl-coenzyme A synthetase/AMP-(fatty) acid ligase
MFIFVSKLENYANKMANLFGDRFNLKKGDCVALFMENKPEVIVNFIFLLLVNIFHQVN